MSVLFQSRQVISGGHEQTSGLEACQLPLQTEYTNPHVAVGLLQHFHFLLEVRPPLLPLLGHCLHRIWAKPVR